MCDAVQSEFATRKAIAADEIAKMPAAGFVSPNAHIHIATLNPPALYVCAFHFMREWVCSKQMNVCCAAAAAGTSSCGSP
jgi:hypothetical protein